MGHPIIGGHGKRQTFDGLRPIFMTQVWLLLSARSRKSGYAPVGMTILLRAEGLFRRIYFGHNGIVIPTGAQRSGGTCCISHGVGMNPEKAGG